MVKMTPAFIQCKIVNIGEPIRTSQLAYATQKYSPLHQAFKNKIKNMKEGGNIQRAINRHQMTSQFCEDYSGKPISMNQCYSAFQLLLIGMLLALLSLILEGLFRPKIMKLMSMSEKSEIAKSYRQHSTQLVDGKTRVGRYAKNISGPLNDEKFLNLSKKELYQKTIEMGDKISQMAQSIKVLKRQNLMLMAQNATHQPRERKFLIDF